MEIDINLSEDKIPAYVLALITLKVLYVAFIVTIGGMPAVDVDKFSRLNYVTDNYLWIPMLFFFVYFYLYRKGKMSDKGLKYAVVCALISIVPKMALILVTLYLGACRNLWEMHLYVVELVAWALIYLYLISFWYSKFKLKEHHHHHHHHHSSEHHRVHSSDFED